MARKINGIEEDIILTGGLLFGGYLLVKHIFPGLFDDGADEAAKQDIADTMNLNGVVNPWNIHYQYSLYGQAPNSYGLSFWQSVQQGAFGDVAPGVVMNLQDANTDGVYNYAVQGELIESAFGLIFSDQATINNAFSNLHTKADVSNVAAYLYFMHGDDLLNLLQNGKGVFTGLGSAALANLITQVNNLPDQ